MNVFRRRKTERQQTINLLEYVVSGENGDTAYRGMGRTRNISGAGLLLETHTPLQSGQTLRITIGLEKETVEILGQVVHVEPFDDHWFWSGIEFQNVDTQGKQVLEKYLDFLSRSN